MLERKGFVVVAETVVPQTSLPPQNLHGDGQLTPEGSSSGICVALAEYRGLDAAVGLYANGACLAPAVSNGLYSFSITERAVDMGGVHCPSKDHNVLNVSARDIKSLGLLAKGLHSDPARLKGFRSSIDKPLRILYLTDWELDLESKQLEALESFIQNLEGSMKTKRTSFSLVEEWSRSGPEPSISLLEYLGDDMTLRQCRSSVEGQQCNTGNCEETGKQYFVTEANQNRETSLKVTADINHEEANERIDCFRRWLEENVVDERTMLIYSLHEKNSALMPGPMTHFCPLHLPLIIGAPQTAIPIATGSCDSEAKRRSESPSLGICIITAPWTDEAQIKMVQNALDYRKQTAAIIAR